MAPGALMDQQEAVWSLRTAAEAPEHEFLEFCCAQDTAPAAVRARPSVFISHTRLCSSGSQRFLETLTFNDSYLSAPVNPKSPERCPERESTGWTSGHQFNPEIKMGYFDPDQERGSSAGGWSRSRPQMRPISSSWPFRLRCCLTTTHPLTSQKPEGTK